jgi:precorrin-4/cobalt-precorrin-4 C11-methyltransferase
MTVYFVGAGPGDPELLTLRAKALLQRADVVVYPGSLINPEVLRHVNKEAALRDSFGMALEDIVKLLADASKTGKTVVRLHSGDPSIYGALGEHIRALEKEGVDYEVVPGISSFQAAAATLGVEYTVPEVVQTIILTRISGRTKVPEKERLRILARSRASMCIFLSAHKLKDVVNELLESYPPDTPVAVVYRASWKDEEIIKASLMEIAARARNVKKTALILIGDFLKAPGTRSRLYYPGFTHGLGRKK